MSGTDPIMDVEAQHVECLLPPSNGNGRPRHIWHQMFLLFHYSYIFRSQANIIEGSPALSRVSSSATSYGKCGTKDEGSENEELPDSSSASPDQHSVNNMPPSSRENEGRGIQLQRLQREREREMESIAKMVEEKKLDHLHNIGGVEGVAKALDTDLKNGIPGNIEERKTSTLPQTAVLGFFHFLWKACKNCNIALLFVAAVLSFVVGIKKEGLRNGWFDGATIILTIIVLVAFRSIRNYWHEKRSEKHKYSSKEREMKVDIIRGGNKKQTVISDVVYGDIVLLKKGCQVPADGLFVDGEALELDDGLRSIINDQNPFLAYGARVINGEARMIVTLPVGMNTLWISKETHTLEARLHRMNSCIDVIGLLICILMLVTLFLRLKLGKEDDGDNNIDPNGEPPNALRMLINSIERIIIELKGTTGVFTTLLSVSLVGIMEGIPFVILVGIIYLNGKTLSDKAIEMELLACVNMGSVTTIICTDKIGGLTEHQMSINNFQIGEEVISESSVVSPYVLELLCQGIGTLDLMHQRACSSTDALLISWAEEKLGLRKQTLKQSLTIVKHSGFEEKSCGVLMIEKNGEETRQYLHCKGPHRKILVRCSHYYDCEGKKHDMDDKKRSVFEQAADRDMLRKDLQTIAFACKCCTDVSTVQLEEDNLILLGLVALRKTSRREDTRKAIETCEACGVKTILVSGDDFSELEGKARACGLLSKEDELVLKGEDFRNFTDEERTEKVDKIRVLGNSQPSDKLLLVNSLRKKGQVVAMVGQRTNDVPAQKAADIGLAFGTCNAEFVKENSKIIIWDGDFGFLVSICKGGRRTYHNIQKFIQLELITIIVGLSMNFIAIIAFGVAPLTTIELLWVNLIVTFLGGLALLTEPPTEELMNKPPMRPTQPFITKGMWRNIVTQALYQVGILLIFQYKGQDILRIRGEVGKSTIFNSYALCQFFNQFNARELEEKNVFKGVHHNSWFLVAGCVFLVLQVAFVVTDQILVSGETLNWTFWAACFLIGIISWLVDWAGKCASSFIKKKKKDWFTGWKIDLGFIRIDLVHQKKTSHIETINMPSSAPSESVSNLHHPLMTGESTAIQAILPLV